MDRATFMLCIPHETASRLTAGTIDLWHALFERVIDHGQADIHDQVLPAFVRTRTNITPSSQMVSRHLRRMAEAGLLDVHPIAAKASFLSKTLGPMADLLNPDLIPAGKFHLLYIAGEDSGS